MSKSLLDEHDTVRYWFIQKTVKALNPTDPVTLDEDEPLESAIKKMCDHGIGCILVVNKEMLLAGVLTERDIIRKADLSSKDVFKTPLKQLMTPNPVVTTRSSSIARALNEVKNGGFRHLPVVHKSNLPSGVVSVKDFLKYTSAQLAKVESGKTFINPSLNSFFEQPISSVVHQPGERTHLTQSIKEVISQLRKKSIGAIPVLDASGVLCGIISERDIVCRAFLVKKEFSLFTVTDLMTAQPETLTPDISLGKALKTMLDGSFRHIPIVDNGGLTGIISIRDIFNALTALIIAELDKA